MWEPDTWWGGGMMGGGCSETPGTLRSKPPEETNKKAHVHAKL